MSHTFQGANALFAKLGHKPIDWPQPVAVTVQHSPLLDGRIAQARSEMGEQRWAELQAEWSGNALNEGKGQ